MSIGKRLFNFARSELNSLLDRAAELDDPNEPSSESSDDDGETRSAAREPSTRRPGRKVRLEDLSDEELEAEIERRRLDKEINDRAARATASAGRESRRERPASAGGSRSSAKTPSDPVARAYAALEVPPGSDFETVRKAYRNLMRKYHPDRHTASPEKQKAANELAQKLTDAYKTLEKRLRR